MDREDVRRAQEGIPLEQVTGQARRARAAVPEPVARARGLELGGPVAGARTAEAEAAAAQGTLTADERLQVLDGFERLLEGVYAHLPLKRARYGFDPLQRLRILRIQADAMDDDAFHLEVARITTELRDAHTRYAGPSWYDGKVAVLPFLVEFFMDDGEPVYVVTKVGPGLDPAFKPGVVVEYWNGVPIDRAVMVHGDNEVGGRPDSRRAWATQSLTFRSLRYSPPPDEHWVIVGYRDGAQQRDIKIPWRMVNPRDIARVQGRDAGPQALMRAVDPAAADVRRAKMLLFAPAALTGEQPAASEAGTDTGNALGITVIPTRLSHTLRATSFTVGDRTYAHLRIFAFDALPDAFIAELLRLIPLLPQAGLVIDVRGNPGGYIWAAERALQLFTPRPIEPTRFSLLATPFTRALAEVPGLDSALRPWQASLRDAVRNGELYSQPLPITEPGTCNDIGQRYGGPVVLVGDCTTYSAGDLFSAGFVDNGLGPFLCVGAATGAGGANVWDYDGMQAAMGLPMLPDGIGLSFSFRRATRSGPSQGLPIEDVGVAGTPYAMTQADLLNGNQDLLKTCAALLAQNDVGQLDFELNTARREVNIQSQGLTQLDAFLDGHPLVSLPLATNQGTGTVSYAPDAHELELVGWRGDQVLQRRRVPLQA